MNPWESITVTDVAFAMYVPPNNGAAEHNDRPYHGFVLNCEGSVKDYIFSDGTVLHTKENQLFYLPKGSSYKIKSILSGGCYAINFYADISDRPFCVSFRNGDAVQKIFKDAELAWRTQKDLYRIEAILAVYELILRIRKEQQRAYLPSDHTRLIAPAVERMQRDFASDEISISALSEMCGISEAYFRRIFLNEYGVTPKEYLIFRRLQYARQLLESGDFTVAQAAQLCGYAEPCHFSREFTKYVGVTPSQYKKKP